ncbi:putative thioredoxin [Microthyrium microscopicum]|uniref:Putative thioredoxin n=1 Tax=Microthyrium microscopicum TaxID=703497 RepID=A0A6A6U856_9PEZI|nr:putative thioredoxin [Microthyrium microscopicum]
MTVFAIDIISDIPCVWCYVGKKRLEQAITLYQKTYPGGKNDTFAINWRPYYLNYNTGASVEKRELTKVKLANMSTEEQEKLKARMHRIGASVGIDFKWGGKIGHTSEAHRLIHLCQSTKSSELQNSLVEKIFEAYHEREEDIADRGTLRDIAVRAGLDKQEVIEWLGSGLAAQEVDAEAERNRKVVSKGVPYFIVNGTNVVDGAQDSSDFLEIFVQIKESKGEEKGDLVTGSCQNEEDQCADRICFRD